MSRTSSSCSRLFSSALPSELKSDQSEPPSTEASAMPWRRSRMSLAAETDLTRSRSTVGAVPPGGSVLRAAAAPPAERDHQLMT